jgi:hypothetical protein
MLFSVLLMLIGCTSQVRVSSDYVLVTPARWNPDSHPGTTLHRGGKIVWGNVYTGYFYPSSATRFARDGMMVFVGPVPVGDDWYSDPQLFAVRGDGPPVVLSERLLHQPLAVFDHGKDASEYAVRSVVPTDDGFRVEFEHNSANKTCQVSWADITRLLDEGKTTAMLVQHRLGDYRLLR